MDFEWAGSPGTPTAGSRHVSTSNALCPYCGAPLVGPSGVPSNKEHLVARQFGPSRVMTGNEFNFLFRACAKCNSEKSNLERHVSSITLFNGPGREVDPAAAEAAVRKALNDFHPAMPGVRVADSHHQSTLDYRSPGIDISFGMVGPPQVYRPYAERLAFMLMQGFYSLVSSKDYRSPTGLNVLQAKDFQLFGFFPRADWGNPQLLTVVERVSAWEPLVDVSTANGYFRAKLLLSRGQGWFWAFEWNKWYRVVGGLCNEPMPLFFNLPELAWFRTPTGRARCEIEIGADRLFPHPIGTDA